MRVDKDCKVTTNQSKDGGKEKRNKRELKINHINLVEVGVELQNSESL